MVIKIPKKSQSSTVSVPSIIFLLIGVGLLLYSFFGTLEALISNDLWGIISGSLRTYMIFDGIFAGVIVINLIFIKLKIKEGR